MPERPQLDIDYMLTECVGEEGEALSGVKILTGQYKDLVYYYTSVKVMESPDGTSATLEFEYKIPTPTEIVDDGSLHRMMGEILIELIREQSKVGGEFVTPVKHFITEELNAPS